MIDDLWAAAMPCAGTIGEKFLRDHGVKLHPASAVRFLAAVTFQGFIAAPAVVFALRKWPAPEVVALESWPLAVDGLAAVRLGPEIWGDYTGAAFAAGTDDNLTLFDNALDALAAFCQHNTPAWGAPNLEAAILPRTPNGRRLTIVDSEPPAPEAVRRWRLEGRTPSWIPPCRFWAEAA